MDGHLDCLKYFTITINTTVNNLVRILFYISGDVSLREIPRSEIIGSENKNNLGDIGKFSNIGLVHFVLKSEMYENICFFPAFPVENIAKL